MEARFIALSPLEKLAHIMRLGRVQRAPSTRGFFAESDQSSCSLGAAYEGSMLVRQEDYTFEQLCDQDGMSDAMTAIEQGCGLALDLVKAEHPCQPGCWYPLWRVVASLNDGYHWSTQRIAAWLESDPALQDIPDDEEGDCV